MFWRLRMRIITLKPCQPAWSVWFKPTAQLEWYRTRRTWCTRHGSRCRLCCRPCKRLLVSEWGRLFQCGSKLRIGSTRYRWCSRRNSKGSYRLYEDIKGNTAKLKKSGAIKANGYPSVDSLTRDINEYGFVVYDWAMICIVISFIIGLLLWFFVG